MGARIRVHRRRRLGPAIVGAIDVTRMESVHDGCRSRMRHGPYRSLASPAWRSVSRRVDITPEMLEIARTKRVYRTLHLGDVAMTALHSSNYSLCTMVLAD